MAGSGVLFYPLEVLVHGTDPWDTNVLQRIWSNTTLCYGDWVVNRSRNLCVVISQTNKLLNRFTIQPFSGEIIDVTNIEMVLILLTRLQCSHVNEWFSFHYISECSTTEIRATLWQCFKWVNAFIFLDTVLFRIGCISRKKENKTNLFSYYL